MQNTDPATSTQHRATADLFTAFLVVGCGCALFIATDTFEWLSPVLRRWEAAELDDLLLSLILVAGAAGWFALRRFRESAAQVAALRRHAAERARYMERLEDLSSQVLEVEERERNRLSDVLHDEIGQTLYACQLRLDLLEAAPDRAARAVLLGQTRELVSAVMTRARDLSAQLSPPALQDLGIAEAIESMLPRLEGRYGLKVRLTAGPAWSEIRRAFYGPVFQSVAELAVNAAKHGKASSIVLSAELDAGSTVRVVVADNGSGFDPGSVKARGFGLFSVERRMACIAGSLEVRSVPHQGTMAILRLPAGA